jgi:hypothetical protein
MPLSLAKVFAEVRERKVSMACATCLKYWDARERGAPEGDCMAKLQQKTCAGPFAGMEFPEYEGPFKGLFHKFCLVCGDKARYGFRAVGNETVFGLCQTHNPEWVKGLTTDAVQLMASKGGPLTLVKDPVRKQTLFEFIAEVEGYYASKRGEGQ